MGEEQYPDPSSTGRSGCSVGVRCLVRRCLAERRVGSRSGPGRERTQPACPQCPTDSTLLGAPGKPPGHGSGEKQRQEPLPQAARAAPIGLSGKLRLPAEKRQPTPTPDDMGCKFGGCGGGPDPLTPFREKQQQ